MECRVKAMTELFPLFFGAVAAFPRRFPMVRAVQLAALCVEDGRLFLASILRAVLFAPTEGALVLVRPVLDLGVAFNLVATIGHVSLKTPTALDALCLTVDAHAYTSF